MPFSCFSLTLLVAISNVVYGRVGYDLLSESAKQRFLHPGNVENTSLDGVSAPRDTPFKAACSFSGESWDPLHDCFPVFGAHDVDPAVGNQMLCKLKQDLEFKIRAEWNHAGLLQVGRQPNISSFSATADCSGAGDDAHKNCNHSAQNRQRFRTCAVVSNSGVLRNHAHGASIDSAGMVLRFNDAPLSGWPHFVGTKDSTRIVNNQFPKSVLDRTLPSYHFKPTTLLGVVDDNVAVASRLQDLNSFRSRYPSTSIRMLSYSLLSAFGQTLRSIYDAHWFDGVVSFNPTTGGIGMLIALSECDEVQAYGMAATPAASTAPYHYYKEDEPPRPLNADENSWHKTFNAEKDLWRRLAQNSASEIDKTDIAVLPGFSQVHC